MKRFASLYNFRFFLYAFALLFLFLVEYQLDTACFENPLIGSSPDFLFLIKLPCLFGIYFTELPLFLVYCKNESKEKGAVTLFAMLFVVLVLGILFYFAVSETHFGLTGKVGDARDPFAYRYSIGKIIWVIDSGWGAYTLLAFFITLFAFFTYFIFKRKTKYPGRLLLFSLLVFILDCFIIQTICLPYYT